MAERQTPTSRGGGQRPQTDYRDGGQRRQAPPRRNNVIRCENCGEDYSVTYKRCPFCDERPTRGGLNGKRVANTRGGGYGRPASALKTASWIGSFLVVIAAMVIIYRFMGAPIFGGGKNPNPGGDSSSTSQSGVGSNTDPSGSDISTPDGPDASGVTPPDPGTTTPDPSDTTDPGTSGVPGTIVNAGSGLNIRSGPGRENSVIASAANGSQITVLGEENGWYQIRYSGNSVGYVSKEFVSTAAAPVAPKPEPEPEPDPEPDPEPSGGGAVTSGAQGTIINAGSGLRVRSGPGTDNSVVASIQNGSTVTILGEEGDWYQIRYSGNSTGYVMKEYVSVS